jgi:hypothetical protein
VAASDVPQGRPRVRLEGKHEEQVEDRTERIAAGNEPDVHGRAEPGLELGERADDEREGQERHPPRAVPREDLPMEPGRGEEDGARAEIQRDIDRGDLRRRGP